MFIMLSASALFAAGVSGNDTQPQNSSPVLRNESISPRNSKVDETVIFKVNYLDMDNDSATYVNLLIDTKSYPMKELDSDDTNYTDGKDFFLKMDFEKGNYLFYFEASDGTNTTTTMVNTFAVGDKYELQWHLDIAAVLVVFIVLAVFIIHYLKQLTSNMNELIKQTGELLEHNQAELKCLAPVMEKGEGFLEGESEP